MWMLKNNKQRGTGLRLEPTSKAFDACFETTTRPGMEGLVLYRWYLAQQYITNPLLIRRRKFGVRVWALVPGVSPLRVYMHTNGLVLFSSDDYQATGGCACPWGFRAGCCTTTQNIPVVLTACNCQCLVTIGHTDQLLHLPLLHVPRCVWCMCCRAI